MNNVSHLTAQAMAANSRPVHFTKVLEAGDIVAADDTLGLAVTWKKRSNDFTMWSYRTGQFVNAGTFAAAKQPDRTRTAAAAATKRLKQLRKELSA